MFAPYLDKIESCFRIDWCVVGLGVKAPELGRRHVCCLPVPSLQISKTTYTDIILFHVNVFVHYIMALN